WGAAKMVQWGFSDGGVVRIPELEVRDADGTMRCLTSNEDKAEAFKSAFFPPAPAASLVPDNAEYPPEAWSFRPPQNHQIAAAIRRMKLYKATKAGTIPNMLFLKANKYFVPHLGPLYRATFTLRYYPTHWALNQTIILCKPGKTNYKQPGLSRPVVVSDGHPPLLNSTVAEDIVKQSELGGLLPPLQFG
ncbi:hypothetical protein BT96DRAFT_775233, partial [Gymnopus androsaceus JB14]